MRITILLTVATLGLTSCYEYHRYPGPVLDLKKLTGMTPLQIDRLAGGIAAEELIRSKRSGSSGFFSHITQSITSGLGKASAGASSSLSGSSAAKGISSASGSSSGSSGGFGSSGGEGGYDYHKPKGTDFFSLKKSILNTIFQALKAITGGVTILKGQLIKGGGALTSGVGNLISVKGEAVANLGRHIVNSASLSPAKSHSPPEVHIAASAPSFHSPPSGPPTSYGPPSSPASSYGSPPQHGYSSSHSGPQILSGPGAPHGSFIPPSSASPNHFASGPSANLIHSTSQSIYPSHGSLYNIPPVKHLSHYEAPHDSSKYSSNGLQAGFIVMKNIGEMPHHHDYQNSHGNLVTTAVDALYGIFKPGNIPPTAPVEEAHDSYDTNNLYSPPPLPSKIPSLSSVPYGSYNDYSVPFKPLNLDSYSNSVHEHNGFSVKSDDDHSTVLTNKLTEMIDNLLGVRHVKKKHYPMPPLSTLLYDPKSSHSTPTIVAVKPGLNPIKLSKVNSNIDKLQSKIQRWDSGRAMPNTNTSTLETVENLTFILKAIQEGREMQKKDSESTSSELNLISTTKSTNVSNIENTTRKEAQDSSVIQKALVFELRGDKLIKLTDEKTDNP